MTRKYLLTFGCLALLLFGVAPTLASPILFDVGFTNDTLDSAPATAAALAGVTNDKPTSSSVTGSGSIVVKDGYTDSVTANTIGGGSDKVAVLTSSSGNATDLRFALHPDDVVTSGKVNVQWTMMVDSAAGASGNWTMYLYDSAATFIAGAQFNTSSKNLVIWYRDGMTWQSTNLGSDFISPGQVVRWSVELDYDTGEQTWKKNGQVLAVPSSFLSSTNYRELRFVSGNAQGILALDNVLVAIPEPASLALGSLGLLLLSSRRPKRSR